MLSTARKNLKHKFWFYNLIRFYILKASCMYILCMFFILLLAFPKAWMDKRFSGNVKTTVLFKWKLCCPSWQVHFNTFKIHFSNWLDICKPPQNMEMSPKTCISIFRVLFFCHKSLLLVILCLRQGFAIFIFLSIQYLIVKFNKYIVFFHFPTANFDAWDFGRTAII